MPRYQRRGRRYGRRFKRYKPIPRGLPTTYLVRLPYRCQKTFNLDPTYLYQGFSMRANGIHDPDPNVGGHSPLFSEQIGKMGYQNYHVLRSMASCKFLSIPVADAGNPDCYFKITMGEQDASAYSFNTAPGVTGQTKVDLIKEAFRTEGSRWARAGLHPDTTDVETGTNRCKLYWNCRKAANAKKYSEIISQPEYGGTVAATGATSDPFYDQWFNFWAICPWTPPSGTLTVAFDVEIILEYVVLFHELPNYFEGSG